MRVQMWSNAAYAAAGLAYALPGFVAIVDGSLNGWRAAVWLAAGASFALLLLLSLRGSNERDHPIGAVISLIAQAGVGVAMVAVAVNLSRYTSAMTLVIVAQQLPRVMGVRAGWMWVATQSVLLGALFWWFDGWLGGLSGGGAYAGIQVFTFGKALLERSEREARAALHRTNVELHEARELLAASSRAAERLRISRDLHDTLGHHLTALILQLDVAVRRTEGAAAEHLREAHAIARLLLAEVRDVVSRLRERGSLDLVEALRPLEAGPLGPRVHLDLPPVLRVENPARAHAIVRCAQEVITNTTRHAAAQNLWIVVAGYEDRIELTARDDGRGAAEVVRGLGLTGMRERFEQLGGGVEFSTSPGNGFQIRAYLPDSTGPSA